MATEGDEPTEQPEREPRGPRSVRDWLSIAPDWLSIGLSAAALVVAIGGTVIANREADAARDQATAAHKEADAAREQVELAQKDFEREESAQARRVNVRAGDIYTLTVENAATLPLRDVSVYLADNEGEPVVEYAFEPMLGACTSLTWTTDDPVPSGFLVAFEDANGKEWVADAFGRLEPITISLSDTPLDLRDWPTKRRPVKTCS